MFEVTTRGRREVAMQGFHPELMKYKSAPRVDNGVHRDSDKAQQHVRDATRQLVRWEMVDALYE